MIDYVIEDREVSKEIEKMEIEKEVDSDHMPVVIWIRGEKDKGKGRENMGKNVNRGRWDREGRENFRKEIGEKEEMRGLDEEFREMRERIKRVIERHTEGTGRSRAGKVGGGGRRGGMKSVERKRGR